MGDSVSFGYHSSPPARRLVEVEPLGGAERGALSVLWMGRAGMSRCVVTAQPWRSPAAQQPGQVEEDSPRLSMEASARDDATHESNGILTAPSKVNTAVTDWQKQTKGQGRGGIGWGEQT